MIQNTLINAPQKIIAKHFGFTKPAIVTNRIKVLTNNITYACKCCGNIQDQGYLDPRNTLITRTNNYMYSYKELSSPFLCCYCHYIAYNFLKQYQKNKIGDIGNIIVFEDNFEFKDFNTSSFENNLYEIIKNPPKAPFLIMLKEQINASTITNMSHNVKPTIDQEIIIVNYGLANYTVFRMQVLNCLNTYFNIRQKQDSNIHNTIDEFFFNKSNSDKFHFVFSNIKKNEQLFNNFISFIKKYNEDTRFVSKIILRTYFKKEKGIVINVNF